MKRKVIVFLILVISTLSSCYCTFADNFKPYPASLKGKKIAIFLDNYFSLLEGYYTPIRLREAGADVKIVSHSSPTVFRDNLHIKTDITPEEALSTKWDGIYVIGGFSPLEMREDKNVIKITQDCNERGGMVAAICHGVTVLVTADIIRGKHITGNVPRRVEFENAGAIFHEIAPYIDGNMITAIGSNDNGVITDAMINWFDGGEQAAKAHYEDKYLKGKKIALVIDQRFEFNQVRYPIDRLTHNGAVVQLVAGNKGEYRDYNNVENPVTVKISAYEARDSQFDALILVSHWAADKFRRDPAVRQFITKNLKQGTLVASMNWAHTALISAGLCEGREFATTWGMQNDINNAGGKALLKPVHRDRNLITCATDEDMPELIRYVVGYLLTVE